MSRTQDASPEILSLLSALCDDAADQENLHRLEKSVGQDPDRMGLIFDYLQLHGDLRFEFIGRKASAPVLLEIDNISTQRSDIEDESGQRPALARAFFSIALHDTIGYFPEGMPLAYLIATVITGLGVLIASHVYMSRPEQVARQSAPLPSPSPPLPSVVGRITGMADCQWKKGGLETRDWGLEEGSRTGRSTCQSLIPNLQSLVSLGDTFALASGLMEITYDTGAKVILQGPATYSVETNGGYLSLGKLTGKLEKGGEGRGTGGESSVHPSSFILHPFSNPQSLIPNPFVVRTPVATVTDLGTEFGHRGDGRPTKSPARFSGKGRGAAQCGRREVSQRNRTQRR